MVAWYLTGKEDVRLSRKALEVAVKHHGLESKLLLMI